MTQTAGFDRFFTLEPLAKRIVEWAGVKPGMRILEPSAGDGSFVRQILLAGAQCCAVELDLIIGNRLNREYKTSEYPLFEECYVEDFLSFRSPVQLGIEKNFHLVIMNPPYGQRGNNKKNIPDSVGLAHRHVAHALDFSDRVVALLPSSFVHGATYDELIASKAHVFRKVELIRRPKFGGPENKGLQARRDYCIFEFSIGKFDGVVDIATERW
jgi:tRNA G10  N-methylase Trm11